MLKNLKEKIDRIQDQMDNVNIEVETQRGNQKEMLDTKNTATNKCL